MGLLETASEFAATELVFIFLVAILIPITTFYKAYCIFGDDLMKMLKKFSQMKDEDKTKPSTSTDSITAIKAACVVCAIIWIFVISVYGLFT